MVSQAVGYEVCAEVKALLLEELDAVAVEGLELALTGR